MKITVQQMNTILDNAPAGVDKLKLVNSFISDGYEIDGVDSNLIKNEVAKIPKTVTEQRQERIDQGLPVSVNPDKVDPTLAGSLVRGLVQAPLSTALSVVAPLAGDKGITVKSKYLGNTSDFAKNVNDKALELAGKVNSGEMSKGRAIAGVVGESALQTANAASIIPFAEGANLLGVGSKVASAASPTLTAAQQAINLGKQTAIGAGTGYGFDVAQNLADPDKTTAESFKPGLGTVLGAAAPAVVTGTLKAGGAAIDAGKSGFNKASNAFSSTKSTIADTGSSFFDRISSPDVNDAARVSLNPVEALKGTGQDIQVSVGGKNKMLSQLTPDEIKIVQTETANNLKNFTKQAELFAKDRSVDGGSPVEIVGSRADKALDLVDKKRRAVGEVMGAVEERLSNQPIPVSNETLSTFSDLVDYSNSPKYGTSSQNAQVVQKMVNDFDALAENGLTIGERNKFIRAWQQYLKDAKDPFGNFKENTTVNTKMEMAVNKLKNETVEGINDPVYKQARKEYAKYMKLQEVGDQLLGKDGIQGERIKGAATVKRAIQSNSDAGSRQFLKELKNITGYDAIKEGDLALIAMENVGDYQGLSLLNVLKEGKSGIINKALEAGQDFVVGNKATRVDKFVNKINTTDLPKKSYKNVEEILKDAPAAKEEIDSIADTIAAKFKGTSVAKAPLKKPDRIVEKVMNESDGNFNDIKDVARNTIISDEAGKNIQGIYNELKKFGKNDPNFKIKLQKADDYMGYSGSIVNLKTKSGLVSEIQVNTPKMIYAKESAKDAKAILGEALYNKMQKTYGEGGLGHKYYEDFRSLTKSEKEGTIGQSIINKSKTYYSKFNQ